jgi:ribonuclease-3
MQPLFSSDLNNPSGHIIEPERRKELKELEKLLELRFRRIDLLDQALSHPSYVNELPEVRGGHYEKLEFLGDAVLELIVSHELYETYSAYEEGDLTKLRAAVVSKPTLAKVAKKIGIDPYIRLGKGEELGGGRKRNSLLADVLEAIIGAIFLDGGLKPAREFVLRYFGEEVERLDKDQQKMDYKSILQEKTQSRFQTLPKYTVIRESGPPHDRIYEVLLTIKDEPYGIGVGRNKKEAQQNAARIALEKFEPHLPEQTGEEQ